MGTGTGQTAQQNGQNSMSSITDNYSPGQAIRCGISHLFHNKENRAPHTRWCKQHQEQDRCWAFGDFPATDILPSGLIEHIITGGAFTMASYKTKRRAKDNFDLAQLLGLDFDKGVSVEQAAADLFIRQYAFLIYPTPSSTPELPKTRVLFLLSEPVYEVHRWEAMQRGLIAQYAHWKADPACKDGARLFYGSDRAGSVTL